MALLLFSGFVMSAWGSSASAEPMRRDTVEIVTASTTHTLDVEVAETAQQKAMGLMFRRSLPPGTGMLFPYGETREITMWMKNTYISLDMVFIKADGRVHRIAERTEPLSERIVASQGPVSAVLEIAAGEAARLGIVPGDRIVHESFANAD